ncbi:MAG: hypothetical protein UHW86_10465 [Spirochaetota bacterium]|jgi:hypothetical protein|nr:hypothetical protein [Spirochaetota bacterium]
MIKHIKYIILLFCSFSLFAQNSSIEPLFKQSQFQNDKLKRSSVIFDFGGSLLSQTELPVKNSKMEHWKSENNIFLWGNITFPLNIQLHASLQFQLFFANQNIVPSININRLFLTWENNLLSIKAGRDVYKSYSSLAFNGTLDAVECRVFLPYVNVHCLTGYSGLTGIFHPDYNDFNISTWDNSYDNPKLEDYTIGNFWENVFINPVNQAQSQRFFLLAEADIYYSFFHIQPYFITQLDFSKFYKKDITSDKLNDANNDLLINTFSFGTKGNFRLAKSLYLFCDISGVFGYLHDVKELDTIQKFNEDFFDSSSANKYPITSMGLHSELSYNFGVNNNFVFSGGYALGLGNYNESTSKDFFDYIPVNQNNSSQFFYYGDFNGGYVLDPVLANIQSFSAKLKAKFSPWLYAYFYAFQTLKLFSNSPISDENAVNNELFVGTELDIGILFNIATNTFLGIDSGLFIPEAAYRNHIPQIKIGATLDVTF